MLFLSRTTFNQAVQAEVARQLQSHIQHKLWLYSENSEILDRIYAAFWHVPFDTVKKKNVTQHEAIRKSSRAVILELSKFFAEKE